MSLASDYHRHKSFIEYRAPFPLYVAKETNEAKENERRMVECMKEAYDILRLQASPFPREPFSTDKLVVWLDSI
jgi:hypothetical protein